MKTSFNWGDDTIDSRYITARHEELQDEYDSLVNSLEEANGELAEFLQEDGNDPDDKYEDDEAVAAIKNKLHELHESIEEAQEALDQFNQSYDKDELDTLTEVISQGEDSPDWSYGEVLIRDVYFQTYIEELINDCYELPKEMTSGDWPWRHMSIDFESAAEEAKSDYTEINAQGETYFIRS